MQELTVAFDISSSLSKAIYATNINSPEMKLATLDVESIKVSKELIEAYRQREIITSEIENNVYIQVGRNYYALGRLARDRFLACDSLKEVKYERGIIRIVATIGLIAQKEKFPTQFNLNLGVLLPYSEISDRQKLQEEIRIKLEKFKFRSCEYQVNLKNFTSLPEGAGVLLRGKTIEKHLGQCSLLVLSIGYRNASYLLYETGKIKKGETSDLGFYSLLDNLIGMTSGLKAEELMPIVLKFKQYQKITEFGQAESELLKSVIKRNEDLKDGSKNLAKAIKLAHQQYWLALSNWMKTRQFPSVDQIILTGGTAHYLRPQLEDYWKGQKLSWADNVEKIVREQLVNEREYLEKYPYRLTDNCAFFFYVKHDACHKSAA